MQSEPTVYCTGWCDDQLWSPTLRLDIPPPPIIHIFFCQMCLSHYVISVYFCTFRGFIFHDGEIIRPVWKTTQRLLLGTSNGFCLFVPQVVWEQQGCWCMVSVPSIKEKPDSPSCWCGAVFWLKASLSSPLSPVFSLQLSRPSSEVWSGLQLGHLSTWNQTRSAVEPTDYNVIYFQHH